MIGLVRLTAKVRPSPRPRVFGQRVVDEIVFGVCVTNVLQHSRTNASFATFSSGEHGGHQSTFGRPNHAFPKFARSDHSLSKDQSHRVECCCVTSAQSDVLPMEFERIHGASDHRVGLVVGQFNGNRLPAVRETFSPRHSFGSTNWPPLHRTRPQPGSVRQGTRPWQQSAASVLDRRSSHENHCSLESPEAIGSGRHSAAQNRFTNV